MSTDRPVFLPDPVTLDYTFDGHAGASPSGAERWMNCTASLGASRRFLETLSPNQLLALAGGSTAARQGTTAHSAGETELRHLLGEIDDVERSTTLFELAVFPETGAEAYDDEMAEHVMEYVDLVRQYVEDGRTVLVEQRVEAAVALKTGEVHTIPGSGDCIILPTLGSNAEPELVVIDYKHGEGIDVDVESNPQVRLYGLGALALLIDDDGDLITPVDRITYHIVQPRNGGIKTWTEPLGDLLDWRDDVLSPALTAALTGDGAEYHPSEAVCQWCPAKGSCAALAEQRVTAAADLFDAITEAEFEGGGFPETGSLDNARLGSLLSQIQGLVKIHDDLKDEAQRRLHRGDEIPGFKLVGYAPPRKWTEDAVTELDHDDRIWQRKLLTPKQALTVLQKQHGEDNPEFVLGDYIDTPVARPVIAKVDDRRKEWSGAPPEQMFTEVGDDE